MHITADRLILEKKMQEIIIVGIDNIGEEAFSKHLRKRVIRTMMSLRFMKHQGRTFGTVLGRTCGTKGNYKVETRNTC